MVRKQDMSEKTIEFFWDVGSPYTYLASTQIEKVAQECGAVVKWRPFLLGGVFRDTGNKPNFEVKAKGAYMLDDLKTWAAYYKVPMVFPSCFPVSSLLPMRAATAADRLGKGQPFAQTVMHLYWAEGKDPSQEESILQIAAAVDLDGEEIIRMAQDTEIKEVLKQTTGDRSPRTSCLPQGRR